MIILIVLMMVLCIFVWVIANYINIRLRVGDSSKPTSRQTVNERISNTMKTRWKRDDRNMFVRIL